MKKIPIWIRLISILFFGYAVFSLLMGIILLVGSSAPEFDVLIEEAGIEKDFVNFMGLALLVISVPFGFVGYGLWKTKNWARLATIIIAGITVFSQLISVITEGFGLIVDIRFLPSLLINLGILLYLTLNKEAKFVFK